MRLEDYKKESLKDPRFREEYKKKSIKEKIAFMVREGRIRKGLTQEELAERMDTKQASISRVESEKVLPSLEFLEKMAKALSTQLEAPCFGFLGENDGSIELKDQSQRVEVFSDAKDLIKQPL